jgi:hypothetical protein
MKNKYRYSTLRLFRDFIVSRDAPNTGTVFAGHPANPKAGYRITRRISGNGLRSWLDNYSSGKISNKFINTAYTIMT